MRGLTHRELGMKVLCMNCHTLCRIDGDGHHVILRPVIFFLNKREGSYYRLYDSCLQDGDYMLGEFPVVLVDGTACLKSTGT